MRRLFTKKVLKVGTLALLVVGLVAGLAFPVLAAPKGEGKSGDRPERPNLLKGTVAGIAVDKTSFDLKIGDKDPVKIKVDDNTKFFMVRLPGKGDIEKDDHEGKGPKDVERGRGSENKGKGKAKAALERVKEVAKDNLGQLRKLAKEATFDDLKVGEHVVVQVMPNENLAKMVFIIKKAPALERVSGTIKAVADGSITITKEDGTDIALKWDAHTRFVLQGLISVQPGQLARAAFNPENNLAKVVQVKPAPPTPTPTPTPTGTST
ncbi:MAG: hypothetical protein HYX81_03155 [Chloroflexi bacterium]|nr:hypothetical protein [Chloroflexota bacterium]